MKDKFLSKWSSWWALSKDEEQLNIAFAIELDKVIESETAALQARVRKLESFNPSKDELLKITREWFIKESFEKGDMLSNSQSFMAGFNKAKELMKGE